MHEPPMNCRPFLTFLAVVFACAPPGASWAASGYAGEFLAVGAGARGLALGGAYVALTNDATSGYWNPAALASS